MSALTSYAPITIRCATCGKTVVRHPKTLVCAPRFCSRACSKPRLGVRSPEAAARMRQQNPMWMPGVKAQIQRTKARNGTDGLRCSRGGNGRTSPTEARFATMFPRLEWGVSIGIPKPLRDALTLPRVLKADFGIPTRKLAIELDGESHRALAVMEADRRKDAALQALGWSVLRIKNHLVIDQPALVRRMVATFTALK